MRKSGYSEEQIINVLKEQQAGVPVPDLCRKHGLSDATFYAWRTKYGGMEVSDARKLKAIEEENRKLKKLLAEAMRDVATLREALGKNGVRDFLRSFGCCIGHLPGIVAAARSHALAACPIASTNPAPAPTSQSPSS
jgi:putative transposase